MRDVGRHRTFSGNAGRAAAVASSILCSGRVGITTYALNLQLAIRDAMRPAIGTDNSGFERVLGSARILGGKQD